MGQEDFFHKKICFSKVYLSTNKLPLLNGNAGTVVADRDGKSADTFFALIFFSSAKFLAVHEK